MVIPLRPAWRCSTGITRWSGTIVGSIVFESTRTLHALVRHEVQREWTSSILQDERDHHSAVDRLSLFDGDGEVQVVTHVADAVGAFFSEAERIPGLAQVLVTSRRVGTVA